MPLARVNSSKKIPGVDIVSKKTTQEKQNQVMKNKGLSLFVSKNYENQSFHLSTRNIKSFLIRIIESSVFYYTFIECIQAVNSKVPISTTPWTPTPGGSPTPSHSREWEDSGIIAIGCFFGSIGVCAIIVVCCVGKSSYEREDEPIPSTDQNTLNKPLIKGGSKPNIEKNDASPLSQSQPPAPEYGSLTKSLSQEV